MDQSEVSRLEHRSNMLLSTLRSSIRATGGELQLIATFPGTGPGGVAAGAGTARTVRGREHLPGVHAGHAFVAG